MRDVFAETLTELASIDDSVVLLTADLGFGVFDDFIRRLPDRFINVGVAEQNLIAVATGLALEGATVFAYSIGNFPVMRCLEQIRNDACYHEANVKIVSVGGGFSYGSLGPSHHATEDLAVIRAIPGIRIMTPGTRHDVNHCVRAMSSTSGTAYLRLDKSCAEESPLAESFVIDHWRIMRTGSDVAIVACGGVLSEALSAAATLADLGISARVVSATQLAPIESGEVMRCIGDVDLVFTVEEHVTRGGLFGVVAECKARERAPSPVVPLGVSEGFVSVVGSQKYLRAVVGLNADSLVATILGCVR